MDKWGVITIIGIGLIVLSTLLVLQFYYHNQEGLCASNPLVYSSKYYEKKYGYPLSGTAFFINEGYPLPLTIYFSSDGLTFDNPYQSEQQLTLPIVNFTK